jgi:hypothetical protein
MYSEERVVGFPIAMIALYSMRLSLVSSLEASLMLVKCEVVLVG